MVNIYGHVGAGQFKNNICVSKFALIRLVALYGFFSALKTVLSARQCLRGAVVEWPERLDCGAESRLEAGLRLPTTGKLSPSTQQ